MGDYWKLLDEMTLEGKMYKITMMEFRKHPGEIISAVQLGATFLVQRHGKTLAVLKRPPLIGKPEIELRLIVDEKGAIEYEL